MEAIEISRIWRILRRGKYLIFALTLLGAVLGVVAYKSSRPIYRFYLTSVGNVSFLESNFSSQEEGPKNYFFQGRFFYQNVRPFLKDVNVSWIRIGERIASLRLTGEKEKILQDIRILKGMFVKFQLSRFAAMRADAISAALRRILANQKKIIFFKERVRLAEESKKYYPNQYSRESFRLRQVDVLPPEAQVYVFKYRIANRESTNRITRDFIEEDRRRIEKVKEMVEMEDEELGETFCRGEGKKWMDGDPYLEAYRVSVCTALDTLFVNQKWEELPSASPFKVFSWAGGGFFGGIFLVLLLGLLKGVKDEQ